jgi:CRP-like cAMP-binding protein
MGMPEEAIASQGHASKKVWYLKTIKLFKELSWKEMRVLQQITKMESYQKNQPIYLPGDESDAVYLLKKGRVKISRVNDDGREIMLTILEPGEIFGEGEVLGGGNRETLVQTLEPTLVCEIQREDFNRYLQQFPHVGGCVTKLMGLRLRQVESRIGELVFKSAPARLAGVLLRLSESMGQQENGFIRLQARLTHQNLASLIGASRETVSTLISQFAQRGLILQDHRYILIKDKEKLAQVK